MTLEEAEKYLANKTCSKTETIKLTVESKERFKRTATGEIIIFKGVRGALLEFKEPNTYTFIVRAHPLKAYFQRVKGGA
jgi:hypothetical protein